MPRSTPGFIQRARRLRRPTDPVHQMTCEETCCNCGDDIGPHHLCTDCLEVLSGGMDEIPKGHE